MTDEDKVQVILNSLRKKVLRDIRICSSDISIEYRYLSATIIDEKENNLEKYLKNFFEVFNGELRYQLQYSSTNDMFKLLQIFIEENAHLDTIIGYLKLNNMLDTSIKSLFM